MTILSHLQDTVVDESGQVIPQARVEVRDYVTGVLTPLYDRSDSATAVPVSNPLTADDNGYYSAYAVSSRFTITTSKNGLGKRIYTEIFYPPVEDVLPVGGGGGGPDDDTDITGYTYSNNNALLNVPGGTSDDTNALLSLITLLNAAHTGVDEGWTLVLSPNTWKLRADVINITGRNKTIIGGFGGRTYSAGAMGQCRISALSSGSYLIKFNDPTIGMVTGNGLRNCAFFANGFSFSQGMVWLKNQQNFRYIENMYAGSGLAGKAGGTPGTALPYTGPGTLFEAVWDSWIIGNEWIKGNPGVGTGAVVFTNSGGNNCNNVRFRENHIEAIQAGAHLYITDTCNFDSIKIDFCKFERGSAYPGAADDPAIYFGDTLGMMFMHNELTNFVTSNWSVLMRLGGLAGGRCINGLVTQNRLTFCNTAITLNNLATCTRVIDNVGQNTTSTRVISSSVSAGNVIENPFTVADFNAPSWEQGTRRFEREAVGFMPISRFLSTSSSLILDAGYGMPLYSQALRVPWDASVTTLAEFYVSTLSKIKDAPCNYVFEFHIRRVADDTTPGLTNNCQLGFFADGGFQRVMPYPNSLPGSFGISSIVGAAGTVTVDTRQATGFTIGQSIIIADTVAFNGTVVIASTPTTTQFTYASGIVASETVGSLRPVNISTIVGNGTTVTFTASDGNPQHVVTGDWLIMSGLLNYNSTANFPVQVTTSNLVLLYSIVGAAGTVTVDCYTAHGLSVGMAVTISGTVAFNGTYTVATVDPNLVRFTYASAVVAVEVEGTVVPSTFTYTSALVGAAETTGNYQYCKWQTLQWTLTPENLLRLGKANSDRLRLKYSSAGTQPCDISGVSITPHRTIPAFWYESVQNSAAGITMSATNLSASRYVRLGLTADATDELPSQASMLAARATQIYDGMQSMWEVANLTAYNLTLSNTSGAGDTDLQMRDLRGNAITTDVIPQKTIAQYRIAWVRGSSNDPVTRIQRIGTSYADNVPRQSTATDTTDSSHTLAAASMYADELYVSGYSATTVRSLTLASAANIVLAVPATMRYLGMSWRWKVINRNAIYTVLATPGGGVTFSNINVIPGGKYDFLITLTNITSGAEAVTITLVDYVQEIFTLQNTGIAAFNGGGQASATILNGISSRIDTVTAVNDSVKFPLSQWAAGVLLRVYNATTNNMDLYPPAGGSIDGLGANNPYSVPGNTGVWFEAFASNVFRSLS